MKRFEANQLREAYEYARNGGQALHVWTPPSDGKGGSEWFKGTPTVFLKTRLWAHLIDYNVERLEKTSRQLGVRIIKIEKLGRDGRINPKSGKPMDGQHVDLCGKPLEKAIIKCIVDGE